MVALHDLHWNFLCSRQMICKQYIILNHVFLNPLQYQVLKQVDILGSGGGGTKWEIWTYKHDMLGQPYLVISR